MVGPRVIFIRGRARADILFCKAPMEEGGGLSVAFAVFDCKFLPASSIFSTWSWNFLDQDFGAIRSRSIRLYVLTSFSCPFCWKKTRKGARNGKKTKDAEHFRK